MSEIIKAHLVVDTFPAYEKEKGIIRIKPGDYISGIDIVYDFQGNRIDVLFEGEDMEGLHVKIDGENPGSIPLTYNYTRPFINKQMSFPEKIGMPVKIDLAENPVEDSYKMIMTEVGDDGYNIHFDLYSNKEGFLGSGTNLTSFCSKNKQVCIKPENWFFREEPGFFSPWSAVKKGDTIRFEIFSMSMIYDEMVGSTMNSYILAKGLNSDMHKLRIDFPDQKHKRRIKEIVIYHPPRMDKNDE
jgi:hypothetical protein